LYNTQVDRIKTALRSRHNPGDAYIREGHAPFDRYRLEWLKLYSGSSNRMRDTVANVRNGLVRHIQHRGPRGQSHEFYHFGPRIDYDGVRANNQRTCILKYGGTSQNIAIHDIIQAIEGISNDQLRATKLTALVKDIVECAFNRIVSRNVRRYDHYTRERGVPNTGHETALRDFVNILHEITKTAMFRQLDADFQDFVRRSQKDLDTYVHSYRGGTSVFKNTKFTRRQTPANVTNQVYMNQGDNIVAAAYAARHWPRAVVTSRRPSDDYLQPLSNTTLNRMTDAALSKLTAAQTAMVFRDAGVSVLEPGTPKPRYGVAYYLYENTGHVNDNSRLKRYKYNLESIKHNLNRMSSGPPQS
jgi:hypothetical protein